MAKKARAAANTKSKLDRTGKLHESVESTRADIKSIRAEQKNLKIKEESLKKQLELVNGNVEETKRLNEELEKNQKNLKSNEQKIEKINNKLKRQHDLLNESVLSTEELDSALVSIGKNVGRNADLFKASKRIIDDVKFDIIGMSIATKGLIGNNKELNKQALDIASGYKKVNYEIITGLDLVTQNASANFDIEYSLDAQREKYQDIINKLQRGGKKQKELAKQYKLQRNTIEETAKSAKTAAKEIKQMHLGSGAISNTRAGGVIDKILGLNKNYLGGKIGSLEDIAKNVAQKRAAAALKTKTSVPAPGTKGNPVMVGNKKLYGSAAQRALSSGAGRATIAPIPAAGTKGNPVIVGNKKLYGSAAQRALSSGTGRAAVTETAAAAGGGGGAIAGFLRVAGPLAAAAGALYMAADALNNGAFIKYTMMADIAMGATPEQIEKNAKFQVEQTKEYRELIVEYNYILPRKLQIEYNKEVSQYVTNLKKDEYEFERSLIKDNVNFEVQKMKEVFTANLNQRKEAASLGISMSDRGFTISAKNLETMGISLTEMVDLSAKMAGKFGISGKQADKIAQTASIIKNRLGLGADEVVDLTSVFRIMSGESAEESIKYIYGLEKFAKETGADVRALSKDLAEAGKEQFKYSNLTVQAFAKQAALLNKMGTSMVSMQKATDTMVGGYKESIKAEMSLSAMIGRRVNLSGVRSRLLIGDMTGAANMLQAQLQGMNVENMNYFAKQQLMQATGLDMNAIMDLSRGKELGSTAAELKKSEAMKQGEAIAAGMRKIELENRAKELKFEQAERYAMLMMEQSFRLQMLTQEFNLRMELERASSETERQLITLKYVKEARAAQALQFSANNNAKVLEDYRGELISKGFEGEKLQTAINNKAIELKGLSEQFAASVQNIDPQMWPSMVTKMIELGLQDKLYDTKTGKILPEAAKYFKEVFNAGLQGAGINAQQTTTEKVDSAKIKQINALLGLKQYLKMYASGTSDTDEGKKLLDKLNEYDPNLIENFKRSSTWAWTGEEKAQKYIEQLTVEINELKKGVNTSTDKQVTAVNSNTKSTIESTKVEKKNVEITNKKQKAEIKPDIERNAKWTLLYDLHKASDIAMQQEQTSLMRLVVEALFDIEENTAAGKDIGVSIDGKRLNDALTVVKDRSYARGSINGQNQRVTKVV